MSKLSSASVCWLRLLLFFVLAVVIMQVGVRLLAGKPEFLLAIAPPVVIGTGFCLLFLYILVRVYLGKSRKPLSPI
jgi:hypothetical protein